MAITKINTPELLDINTTGAKQLPSGTTAQRPATGLTAGDFRYNTDDNHVEYYDGAAWFQIDYEAVAPTCTTDTINYPVAVTAYYKMSDATDQTGNYNGTATSVDFNVQGKFGNAGEFNGSSSKIDLPNGITSAMGVNDFSFSYWINLNSVDASLDDYHLSFRNDIYVVMFSNRTDRALRFIVKSSGGTFTYPNTSYTVPLGDWINITFVKSSTTGIEVFVNGASVYTDSTYTGNVSGNSQSNQIGAIDTNGINAKIDQVRIFPTALTAANVTSLYNEVQCAPTIVPSQHFNANTYFGTGATQAIDAKFNEAANFNGSTSKIGGLPLVNDNTTVSYWFNSSGLTGNRMMFSTHSSGSDGWEVNNDGTNLSFVDRQGLLSNKTGIFSAADSISSGVWYHCAITTTTNQISFYLNGQIVGTASKSTPYTSTNTFFGFEQAYNTYYWGGKIDQVRIFDTALIGTQVTDLYNNETDATAQLLNFPVGAGCIAAYELDGNADDISGLYSGTPTDIGYTGMEFQPDLVWLKSRSATWEPFLQDSLRGAGNYLRSNSTGTEGTTVPNIVSSFDTNGFTVLGNGNSNNNNDTYVAWNWKAGGAPTATNSAGAGNVPTAGSVKIDGADSTTALAGTIAATSISANTEAGFSIVTYTTQSSGTATVGHGLSSPPDMVIVKTTQVADSWRTYHSSLGAGFQIYLNLTNAAGSTANQWNNTAPTSSVFTLGTDNAGSYPTVAYCFASIPGMSDIGSYVGTGATGNSIVTGFRPAFLMVKLTSAIDGQWVMYDNKRNPTNPRTKKLAANLDVAENDPGLLGGDSSHQVNFLSNGFELLQAGSGVNTNKSGETYIFMAFAAEPTPEPVLANSFKTVIYTGTGTTGGNTLPVTGFGFQPDLVWVKNRDVAVNHYLYDSVRGTGTAKALHSNTTSSESAGSAYADNGGVSSFLSDGFTAYRGTDNTYQGTNMNGQDYVAWAWKASNDSTINQDGSISSIVSANPAAGFSVVSWNGNSSNGTLGHGLGSAPKMIIVKNRSIAKDWTVYSEYIGNTSHLYLNATNAAAGGNFFWNATSPTSSVFSVSSDSNVNSSLYSYIAYCFADVDGYQKVGSYSGGSSGSGNVISTGFKPTYVMLKVTNASGEDWHCFDSVRGGGDTFVNDLRPNTSEAESTFAGRQINFVSDGFYWTGTEGGVNGSGRTYIYLAIA